MRILGINALNHDASISLIDNGEVVFAAHSERYSGIKNDSELHAAIFADMYRYGKPDKVAYFERPWLKKYRQLKAGQYKEVFQLDNTPKKYLKRYIGELPINYVQHHQSHAAAGYYTSPYDEACIVNIDAIGEFETATIWYAWGSHFEKRWSMTYPQSLGLFYSAITQRLGLKPQEDEYILMGMAAYGQVNEKIKSELRELLHHNLHRGCLGWDSKYYPDDGSEQWKFHIAANTQSVIEEEIQKIFLKHKELVPETDNCVYMGGVALNCVANSIIARDHYPKLWILPNPGDAGSSLGCAAYLFGEHVNWKTPFTGYDIKGRYPWRKVLNELLDGNIVGVASGRRVWAKLGNRSLKTR